MTPCNLPDPIASVLSSWTTFLDSRQHDLVPPLFLGLLLAHGRRTVTSWFRPAGITNDFRRAYHLLGSLGKNTACCAAVLFHKLRRRLPALPRWLFALDDTPTQRYGPCVEGAGRHHNPTPGPAQQKSLYGHVWVTLSWMVRHPLYHTLGLPLLAALYVRQADLERFPPDKFRPTFQTKLEQAGAQIRWVKEQLRGTDLPIWFVFDGAYSKEPVLRVGRQEGVILVGRLRKDAALRSVPEAVTPGQRPRGRPRIYGEQRFSLAKRAGQGRGWQQVECVQYQKKVTKTVKTFLATWRPARGVIRVVLVKEEEGWLAYFCSDATASVTSILEAVADRTGEEQVFCDIKEVEGAGQQQLRDYHANVGAFHWNLWGYSLVEGWAWEKPTEEICDRSQAPWDQQERRPSHRDKRKALQQEILRGQLLEGCQEEAVKQKIASWWDGVAHWLL
jgi:DDE superfamily endonuclease